MAFKRCLSDEQCPIKHMCARSTGVGEFFGAKNFWNQWPRPCPNVIASLPYTMVAVKQAITEHLVKISYEFKKQVALDEEQARKEQEKQNNKNKIILTDG